MEIHAWVCLLVAVLGAVVFVSSDKHPDLKEIGRCLMYCGVLVSLFMFGGGKVSIGAG